MFESKAKNVIMVSPPPPEVFSIGRPEYLKVLFRVTLHKYDFLPWKGICIYNDKYIVAFRHPLNTFSGTIYKHADASGTRI